MKDSLTGDGPFAQRYHHEYTREPDAIEARVAAADELLDKSTDEMDSCCKKHDQCYDTCSTTGKTKAQCDKEMCDCLKDEVDPGDFRNGNDQIDYGKLKSWACGVQGGGK